MGYHEAIIKQDTYRRTYYVGFSESMFYHYREVKANEEYVETDIIWSGELDSPALEVGEQIYITELDRFVTVEKIIRTTLNEYMYYIHEVIEDEKTKESLEAAKEKLKKYNEDKIEENNQNIEELTKKNNWFKRLFSR